MSESPDPLYLDHAATTPTRPEVSDAMARCVAEAFGNPSSRHEWGRRARKSLEDARCSVADDLGVPKRAVYFVRGGTESDNIAVLGRCRMERAQGRIPVVVTSSVEHPAVFEAAEQTALEGGRHVVIDLVDGALDLDALDDALAGRPSIVSCMWVNNETGLVLPIEAVAERCLDAGIPLHSDAVQAVGKIDVATLASRIDLVTVTGHKIYGPKGTGILVTRDADGLHPMLFGGGQEERLRPGTEDVAGAVGFAVALRLALVEQRAESERLESLRDAVEDEVLNAFPDVRVNGTEGPRAPHISSLGIPSADMDTLLAVLDASGLAASGGSACASGSSAPSRTLDALYGTAALPSLRLSFGKLVDADDLPRIVDSLKRAIAGARSLAASG